MAFLEWNEKLEIGISSVDQDHKKLVDLINQVHNIIINEKNMANLEDTVNALLDYTVYHFKREEVIFKKINYVDREYHEKSHAIFINDIQSFKEKLQRHDSASEYLDHDILDYLKNWLTQHILDEDSDYVKTFKANGIT